MIFRRKAYDKMLEWKRDLAGNYACMLEGARRVGKTTLAEVFARQEYRSFIRIDFANITDNMLDIFRDIAQPDIFFLRLQAETNIELFTRESVIIFDEIQLYPKARQAIKYLVQDGRYDYIETGSLISISKNVRNIVIPSEEHTIRLYPMDYEEFLWATGSGYDIMRKLSDTHSPVGNQTNRKLMRDLRIYMAVGGMPQAVAAYIAKNDFNKIDTVKREIISLYKQDLMKIDPSGRLSAVYDSIPVQLALKKKRFIFTAATGKKKTSRDEERFYDLVNSQVVIPCFRVAQPVIPLAQTRDTDHYKLYLSDTGLFTTMLFNDSESPVKDIYCRLLGDDLPADLGYLYENMAAQMLRSHGRELYYHTWEKEDGNHYYEIDFLLSKKNKVIPLEIKSSATGNHTSISEFSGKYPQSTGERYIFSQKDIGKAGEIRLRPFWLLPAFLDGLDKE